MASINIGGDKADASFRYKMPRMQTKIEGRGNGIKTVILNMADVAKALNVDPDYPTKFFGLELGSQSKYDRTADRAIVNGAHDGSTLAQHLENFIKLFVLCPNCNLPEIIWQVSEKAGTIKVDCAACGNHSQLKHGHKLVTYILKHPPVVAKKNAKGSKEDKKAAKKGKKSKNDSDSDEDEDESKDGAEASKGSADPAAGHQAHIAGQSIMDANAQALAAASAKRAAEKDDKEEWSEDTSKEAQMQRRLDEMRAMGLLEEDKPVDDATEKMMLLALSTKEKDSPVWVLRRFTLEAQRSPSQILAELRRLELARNLSDAQRYRTLLEALLDTQQPKNLVGQLKANLPLLRKAASDKLQLSTLFGAFEEVLGTVDAEKCLPRVPLVLQALYEADLFDEEFLVCWFDSPPESSLTVSRPVAVELRKRAQPFIEWLKNASDDEEDDDEDESDDE